MGMFKNEGEASVSVKKEKTEARRDEILDALDALYKKSQYCNVTVKDIAAYTSFSRPSIYNYFRTIQEIFLGLLTRECNRCVDDLQAIIDDHDQLDADGLASALAHVFDNHQTMLRIQSNNLNEIEEQSRLECLVEFKTAMECEFDTFDACLKKFLPGMTDEKCQEIRFQFFPYLNGVYSYAHHTDKQVKAMDIVGTPHPEVAVYQLVYSLFAKLLQP